MTSTENDVLSEIPKTQRTWTVSCSTPARSFPLKLNHYAPTPPKLPPASSNNTLIIKLHYSSLNPVDLFLVTSIPLFLPWRRHPIPAFDFAGVVVSAGSSVSCGFKKGDYVAGAMGIKEVWLGMGTLSEYIEVDCRICTKVPDGLVTGAGPGFGLDKIVGVAGIAGQTAQQMVERVRGEQGVRGKRVLVYGASGGVGSLVVQICRGLGCEKVWGVCSGGNKGLVEGLGGEVIDYTKHDDIISHLAERFSSDDQNQLDVVFECAESHDRLFAKADHFLKPDGQFISVIGGWSQGVLPFIRNKMRPTFLGGVPRSYDLFLLGASGEIARKAVEYLERGVVREVLIDSEFGMEDVIEAFERLATGRAKGKVVIKVGSE
ncbi:hypothetical protein QBC43DRAFT_300814 [Cladorrhinum sp. PSN259]|nr:hypothetical protein QBC43DRAFT_300814 [Cladorrhinum sp. PSN259]